MIAAVPSNVVVLTSNTFNFLDETKDVLVEFYPPWCDHCTSLAPFRLFGESLYLLARRIRKLSFPKIEEEVEKLKGSTARYGKIYLKAAKNCIDKGADYTEKETARLQRIHEKLISAAKADELTLKKVVLSALM